MCTLQEWKETDPPASTAGSLTEILTGDPLHPVSEEQLALSLGANKSRFAPLFTFFFVLPAGADKKAEAGAGAATEFQFVSIEFLL